MKEDRQLRILLVTREALCGDRNEGNVLINLFEGCPVELSQVYCKPELPDNDRCQGRYFQLTDRMALDKVLHGLPMGKRVCAAAPTTEQAGVRKSRKFYDFFRRHNWSVFYLAQDILWRIAGNRYPELDKFIDEFRPDIVFAPLTPYVYANRLQNYVMQHAGVSAVTYIYDDIYSLKQFRLSPFYWLHRFSVRKSIRQNLPLYQYAYTMTEQQKREYEKILGIPMRVLRKCAPERQGERIPHEGIRLIYAGNIYYGRDGTLAQVADAVRALQGEGQDVELHIYTSSPLRRGIQARLDDGKASFVHPAIPATVLVEKYAQSDIALHVESFQKKNALVTRLSFSTKIVDCLASGCAVLAVCPSINAGWQYLRDEGAALCVSDPKQISDAVRQLVTDAGLRRKLETAAQDCLGRYHRPKTMRKSLYNELLSLVGNTGDLP